jgi:hypothetical protein
MQGVQGLIQGGGGGASKFSHEIDRCAGSR